MLFYNCLYFIIIRNIFQGLESQNKKINEELDELIKLRDIRDSELERALKEVNEQMMKLNRADSRIQFDMKQINKSCGPDKRCALELIKVTIAFIQFYIDRLKQPGELFLKNIIKIKLHAEHIVYLHNSPS